MKDDNKLGALQERHSELCARAADTGVKVPEALTVDFDTVEAGLDICAQLEKLLADEVVTVALTGLAADSEVVQDAPSKPKKAKKAKVKKAKPAAPAAAPQQESDEMAKTAKKTSVMKAAAKKTAPKKGAVKKAAKKSAAKKAKAPRGDTKVSKVIARLKNGGITRAEILKMTGWKAVSVQQLAKSAGLTLKQTDERPFRYSAK